MTSRSLTLRYIINLAGNLQRRAAENARVVEQASRRQTTALASTDKAAQQTDRSLQKVGSRTNAVRVEAEARRMQGAMGNVAAAVQRADAAMSRFGTGRSSLERTYTYLGGIARRMEESRRHAERLAHVLGRTGQVGGAVAGGAVAGGAAAVATLKKPVAFEEQIAHMVNLAFPNRDTLGRLAGARVLEARINDATRFGGGSRESAATALNSLLASGALGEGEKGLAAAFQMLPDLQQAATASGANVTELAEIAYKAIQNFGLKPEEIGIAMAKAIKAGQEGSFEIKDMAKWLPEMMGSARTTGLNGMAGFETILSAAQTAMITAGSKDAGGNNLVNLLGKMGSPDTRKDFEKLGIDLSGSLARAREQGIDSVTAFTNFLEQVGGRDKRFAQLKARAQKETEADKKATLEAMADILHGSAVGQVIQDRQALMAAVALMTNKDYTKRVLQAVQAEQGETTQANYAVIQSTGAYKAQQIANEVDIARSSVLHEIEGPLKSLLDSVTALAREFPTLTTAITGAAQAASIVAAGSAGGAIASILLNRRKAGGGSGMAAPGGMPAFGSGPIPVYVVNKVPGWNAPVPGTPNAGGGASRAGTAGGAAAAGAASRTSRLLRGAGLLGAGVAAYDVSTTLLDSSKSGAEKSNAVGRTAAGMAGAWAGAKLGAAAGGFAGPLAPIAVPVGGLLGGIGGYFGAQWAGDSLSNLFTPPSKRAGVVRREDGTRVELPPEARAQLGMTLRQTPAYMSNPALQPGPALAALAKLEPQKVDIGEGKLGVSVVVRDERTFVNTSVLQQPSALRIDAGNTNPGKPN
ncbi:phage tail tape measure protein [Cupriavidus gilardii]|uniref:phage tail tape measure protein n=3 Tax=Cupriavidus gilardii TaxID=82541 RepID=UPI001EE54A16|nr:phage tail tape measure protein [Cupriavidus gilardii]MCG5260378.1 phage tail tape measure protein [Cupriavidus gilardii]MDF9428229.1 phage tail tape measure protein [Cupriavidus gilardii]